MRILQNTIARPVSGVSFAQDGKILFAGGSGGYDVWHLPSLSHSFIKSHAVKNHYGCRCDPEGRWAYVSDSVAGIRLLPLDDRGIGSFPGSRHELHARSFDLTPNGERLVVSRGGSSDNRLECWGVRPSGAFTPYWALIDGKPVAMDEPYLLNQAKWTTNAVAIFPNGKMIVAAENRATKITGDCPLIVVRDGSSGKVIADLGYSNVGFGTELTAAPDGRTVYVWDRYTSGLERWDIKTGKLTKRIPPAGRAFQGVAIHPTKRIVVTVSTDGSARYWDPLELTLLDTVRVSNTKLHTVAISPNGTSAAAGGEKGQVFVWDLDF